MPLFKCIQCGCIDNTACGGSYWGSNGDAKCSECFTGKWEAPFDKKTPEEMGLVLDTNWPDSNFYSTPANVEMVKNERAKRKTDLNGEG